MSNRTFHTIRLQDGTLCNLNKRLSRQAVPLAALFRTIPDPRRAQGKRHALETIVLMVFVALLRGSKDLKDVGLFTLTNRAFFRRQLGLSMPHGVPDASTLSRTLRVLDPGELVRVFTEFLAMLNLSLGDVWSFDGKTMRAVTGEGVVRHILSFFSHDTHLALGQIGVDSKENEIPAFDRLLAQSSTRDLIYGKLLLGDALHTQRVTVTAIVAAKADYLFVVKGNQKGLRRAIQTKLHLEQSNQRIGPKPASYTYETTDRQRTITTTVTAMTASDEHELALPLAGSQHWTGVRTAGILHRTGTRISKDGKVALVDETIGFISSRNLTAEEVAIHLRAHWCIENNLHWVKDEVFERRQTYLAKRQGSSDYELPAEYGH